jgi:hypothetical protein
MKRYNGRSKKFSIRDILNKFKWHPDFDFNLVEVTYIHRPEGFSKVNGGEIIDIGHKFIYLVSGNAIPVHRIVEIKYAGEVVWRRGNESCEEQAEKGDE